MFQNYLKTTLRNLLRYKGYTFINVLGLTIGIAGCLLIGLFVVDENKFDRFIPEHENIYRVYDQRNDDQGLSQIASVPPAFAPYLEQNYPEVAGTARVMMTPDKRLVESGEKQAFEEKGFFAENSFLHLFPLKVSRGNRTNALVHPYTAVLTRSLAEKYFGATDPVGKNITIDKENFMVTAVLEDVPGHFHFPFRYLLSFSSLTIPKERMESWGWQQFWTYLKLKNGTDPGLFQQKFQQAVKKIADPITSPNGSTYLPFLQPLKDVHLYSSDFLFDPAKRGNARYVKGLSVIAIFVLVIACFNFVNLATARSSRRAKEIGVRKVVGAGRLQLVLQFIGETILLSIVSVFIAVILAMLVLPFLNQFTGKSISFNPFMDPAYGILLLGVGVLIGIISGIYPAFFLSGFQPVTVLKGSRLPVGNSQATVRQVMVVLQFALSAMLIVCTMVVYRQMKFLHQKDLGFQKDQVVLFTLQGKLKEDPTAFKHELLQSSNIVAASAGYGFPGSALAGDDVTVPKEKKTYPAKQLVVDHDYVKTLGLQLIAGRDFSKELKTDSDKAFILNESGVRQLGLGTPQKALGQELHWKKWFGEGDSIKRGTVIGVVKDFHYSSLHEKVGTAVIQVFPVYEQMAVKVKTADLKNTLAHIQKTWEAFNTGYPLDYQFLDENFARMYASEDKLSTLLWIFTGMAIFVGCLGLFGLAAFSAEQRTREIGIRKVLGASVVSIAGLLSQKFMKPVFIASLLAFPVAWWAMSSWLEDFPYRVAVSWWIFMAALAIALLIALVTVSFQAIKAAVVNPVNSLRSGE